MRTDHGKRKPRRPRPGRERKNWLRKPPIRRQTPIDLGRAANRVHAYLYGNILVLAALAVLSQDAIESGHGALLIVGTAVTTYVAHVVADVYSHRIRALGQKDDETRRELFQELRDAVPIASSASMPTVILIVAWIGWLPPLVALTIAIITVVVRFVLLGSMVGYLTDKTSSWRSVLEGVALAGIGIIVVALKVLLAH
jgi:hypothetical protein